jgi:uncharacterized membrane protein YvlD (DUF360 family)
VIRFIFRTLILLVGNAIGLIVAAIVLGGVRLGVTGFIFAVIIFTVCTALLTPFLASTFRRGNNAALGGVSLIATLIALIITDIVSSGLSISGLGDWLAAAVIVWGASLLAVFILPFLGLKKYVDERRA